MLSVGDFTVSNDPQSVLKCCSVLCFIAKIGVSDKLLLGMSCSTIGCKFNANESKYMLNKVPLNRIHIKHDYVLIG